MSNFAKKNKAFTLIEVIVSLAVFLIIMMAVMQIFGVSFKAYKSTRALQHDLENAQYAINAMAKEIRTSSIITATSAGNSFRLVIFDYSQNSCIQYSANLAVAGALVKWQHGGFVAVDPNANRDSCENYEAVNSWNPGDYLGPLVPSGVTRAALFAPTLSQPIAPGPGKVGRLSFSLTFASSTKPVTLQTTVSLRDFNYVGI